MLSDGAGAMLLQNKANKNSLSLKINSIDRISYAGEMPTCIYSGCEINKTQIKSWRTFDQKELMKKSILSISQDVKLLNKHIIEYTVTKPLKTIIKKRNLKEKEITYFLPHYSSEFFKDKLYEGMKQVGLEIPYEKWFTNLSKYGNTGSASRYIMLEELFHSKTLNKGETILCYIPESGRFSTSFMCLEVV